MRSNDEMVKIIAALTEKSEKDILSLAKKRAKKDCEDLSYVLEQYQRLAGGYCFSYDMEKRIYG